MTVTPIRKLVWMVILVLMYDNTDCSLSETNSSIQDHHADNDTVDEGELQSNIDEQGTHFESDILLSPSLFSGMVNEAYRWPSGVISYELDPEFSSAQVKIIYDGMQHISSQTCITFSPKTTEIDYVYIRKGALRSGCNSYVGRVGGEQVINLQVPGCMTSGIVAHELIHAVGFRHEHSRSDRDEYIEIEWNNVNSDFSTAFKKYGPEVVNSFGVPYDYGSIMHYSAYAFALRKRNPTIIPRVNGVYIGQRRALSAGDVQKIKNMYKC